MTQTTEAYGEGDKLVVIEHIPVISCRNCGDEFFTAETMHRLDQLINYLQLNPASRANERTVKVASFQAGGIPMLAATDIFESVAK